MFKENADAAGIALISSWTQGRTTKSFSGIVYLSDSIIIGQAGFDIYAESQKVELSDFWDGRFSYFEQNGDNAHVITDYMGQDIVFYYHENGNWAASNSFLYLSEYLAAQNVKLTPHIPALIPYLVPNSFTQQLVTESSGIKEIRMLPATDEIRVVSGMFNIVRRVDVSKINEQVYADTLVEYAEKWTARCHALLEGFPNTTKVDITGGRDSRTLLALICAGGADISKINFCSSKAQTKDFEVAQNLSRRYSFAIRNNSIPSVRVSSEAMYELWKYGNLGIYYPVYIAGGMAPSDTLHFHGAGGGCLREVYQNDFVDAITNKLRVSSSLRSSFRDEIFESLNKWALSAADFDNFGTLHYRNCRSRMHFGRNWFRSLFGTLITPISSWDLVRAVSTQSKEERARAQIYCDLMLLCKPELAYEPFDTEQKSFSQDTLSSSPFVNARPSLTRLMGTMNVYRGELKGGQKTVDSSLSTHKQLLLRDLRSNEMHASSLNILPKGYAEKAALAINSEKSLTKGGQKAAHLISVGEIVKLCS